MEKTTDRFSSIEFCSTCFDERILLEERNKKPFLYFNPNTLKNEIHSLSEIANVKGFTPHINQITGADEDKVYYDCSCAICKVRYKKQLDGSWYNFSIYYDPKRRKLMPIETWNKKAAEAQEGFKKTFLTFLC